MHKSPGLFFILFSPQYIMLKYKTDMNVPDLP